MNRTVAVAIVAAAGLTVSTWAWAQQGGTGLGMMGGPGGPGGTGMGSGMMGQQAPGSGAGLRPGTPRRAMGMDARMGFAERPLISEMLSVREQLGLSPAQVEKLRGLRSGFEKDAIKKQAEVRVAEVDLSDLLAANPTDLAKIEAQVMKIASLRGSLRFARIKTLEEGRAVLSQEQWQKFQDTERWPRGFHGGRWQEGQVRPAPHGMMGDHDPDDMMGEMHEQFTSHGGAL